MAGQKVEFLTPVGRLVQGDPFKPQTTDMQGQPLVFKTGPQAGQPRPLFMANIAVAKNDPVFQQFYYGTLLAAARAAWPQFFQGPVGPDGQPSLSNPNFSLKVMDGDGFDGNGKPNSQKEGMAGHWIIKTSSSYAPRCFRQGHYAPHEELKNPADLRRGYFVRVSGTIESNNNPQKPGMYINLGLIELVGIGPEITSGPDAASVFGGAPVAALPQGAQALPQFVPPVAGVPNTPPQMPPAMGQPAMPMGGMPAMPGAPAMPMGQPAMPMGQPAMPMGQPPAPAAAPTFVQPNPGMLGMPAAGGAPSFTAPAGLPGMPAMGQPPAAPAVPQLTAKGVATGMTYQQMIAGGWNDAQLRQGEYIV